MRRDNQALLLSLGLGSSGPAAIKPAAKVSSPLVKLAALKRQKRKQADSAVYAPPADNEEAEDEEGEEGTPKRRRSISTTASVDSPLRRSARSSRRTSRLADEVASEASMSASPAPKKRASYRDDGDREPMRQVKKLGVRTEDPKQFGHIPGVEVGRCWATRMECSTDAIHA